MKSFSGSIEASGVVVSRYGSRRAIAKLKSFTHFSVILCHILQKQLRTWSQHTELHQSEYTVVGRNVKRIHFRPQTHFLNMDQDWGIQRRIFRDS